MLGGRKACSNYFSIYWHRILPVNVIIYILGTDHDKDQLERYVPAWLQFHRRWTRTFNLKARVIFLTNHLHGNFHHFIDLRYALDSDPSHVWSGYPVGCNQDLNAHTKQPDCAEKVKFLNQFGNRKRKKKCIFHYSIVVGRLCTQDRGRLLWCVAHNFA